MTETQMISGREAVMRQRTAFIDGVVYANGYNCRADVHSDTKAHARRRFPLPKIKRQRVVRDVKNPNVEWTVIDGALKMRTTWNGVPGDWMPWRQFRDNSDTHPSPERVEMWANLFANPTEEVEDDGQSDASWSMPG